MQEAMSPRTFFRAAMKRLRHPWIAVGLMLGLAACQFHPAGIGGADGGGALDAGAGDLSAPGSGDPFPTGAISFFRNNACPDGWTRYTTARGRAIVPAPDEDGGAGSSWGTPLTDGEERLHGHDGGSVPVSLPDVSFVGATGSGNAVGQSGTVALTLASSTDKAAIPYVELWSCKKLGAPVASGKALPSGLVSYFEASCPVGWSPSPKLQGRYLVGLPAGAKPGLPFGGAPLHRGEERSHTHDVAGFLATSPKGILLASGCCGGGFAANGSHGYGGTSAPESAAIPYVQLTACIAN
jgi:hypothetical protein